LRVRSAVTAGLVAAAVALTGPAAPGQAQGQPPPEPVRAAIEVLTQAQAQLDQAQVELDVAIAGGLALQREHDELVDRQVELELDRVGDRSSPALDEVEGRLADVRDRMREADAERSERSAEVERRQEAVRAASEGVDLAWVQVLADQANERWAEVEAARAALDAAVAALGDGDDPAATAAVAAATSDLERATVAHGAALDLVDQELKRQQQDRSTLEEDRDVQLGQAIDLVRERAERYAGLRLQERHFESMADLIRHRQQGPDRAVRAAGATRAEADGLGNWLERASGASATMVAADASARQAMRELGELTGELGLAAPADAYDVAALVAHETAAAALAAAQAARNVGGILRDEERGAFMEELAAWADRWEDLAEELLEVERFQATQSEAAELRAAAAAGDPEAVWELTVFLRRWSEELGQAALEALDDTAVRAGDLAEDIWADRLVRLERQLAIVEEQFEAALATPGAQAPALPAQVAAALEGLGDDDRLRRVEDRVDVLADAFEALRALRDQTRTQEALLRDEVQDLRRELAAEAARGPEADRGRLEQLEDLVAEEQARVAELRRAALTLAEQVERIGKDMERDAAWLAKEADRLGREARRAARKLGRDADAAERRRVADQAVAAAEAARRALAAAERTAGTAEDDEVLADRVLARRRVAARAANAATLRVHEAEAAERARQAVLRRRAGGGDPDAARTLLATLERQRAELDQGDVLEPGRRKGGRSRLDRRRAELDREIEALRDKLGEPAPESEAPPDPPEQTEPAEPTEPPPAGRAGKDTERRTPEANAAPAPDPAPEPGPGGQAPLATEPAPLPAAPVPDAPPATPATPAPEQPTPWVPTVEAGEDEEGDGAGTPAWVPLRIPVQGSLGDAPSTCGPKGAATTCAPDPPVVGAGDPCLDRGGLGAVMATCAPPEDPLDTGTIFDPLPEELTGQRLIFDPPPDDDLIGKPRILDPKVEPPTGPSCGLAGNVLVTCKDDLLDPAVIVTWSGSWLGAEPPAADRPASPALLDPARRCGTAC
jgi:hypothetical protein